MLNFNIKDYQPGPGHVESWIQRRPCHCVCMLIAVCNAIKQGNVGCTQIKSMKSLKLKSDDLLRSQETTVVVELSGIIDRDWAANIGDKCKILGMESEQPVMQLDRYIFTGEYQDAIGSHVLLEQKSDEDDTDEEDTDAGPRKRLEYSCKTHKKLSMKRAFLVEKEDESSSQVFADVSRRARPPVSPVELMETATASEPDGARGNSIPQDNSLSTRNTDTDSVQKDNPKSQITESR